MKDEGGRRKDEGLLNGNGKERIKQGEGSGFWVQGSSVERNLIF